MERGGDAGDHCCWAGQAWNGSACVGEPSSCPTFHVVEGDQCVLPVCQAGMQRAQDAAHCCWPGQAWSSAKTQCVGTIRCLIGFTLEGAGCTANDVIAEREAAASADAERTRQAAEAARIKAEADRDATNRAAAAEAARVTAAAEQKAALQLEEQRKQAESKRREDIEAERQRRVDEHDFGVWGTLVLSGVGVAGVGTAAICMFIGAEQNDAIATGRLPDLAEIDKAAGTGQLVNAVAWTTGLLGVLSFAAGGIWFALNPEPGVSELEVAQ